MLRNEGVITLQEYYDFMYCVRELSVPITQKQADEKAALLKAQLEKRRRRREEGPVVSKSPEIPHSKSPEIPARSPDKPTISPDNPAKLSDKPANLAKAGNSAAPKTSLDNRPIRPSKVPNKFESCVTAGEAITDPAQPPQLPKEEILPKESGEPPVKPVPAFVVKEDKKKSGTFVKDKNSTDVIFIANEALSKPDSDGSVCTSTLLLS